MDIFLDIPEPVFKKFNVDKKKKKKLFRRWGEVRVISPDGAIGIIRQSGWERAY